MLGGGGSFLTNLENVEKDKLLDISKSQNSDAQKLA